MGQVSIEELDQVQADIEILLASVGRRLKLLGSENHVLASWPDKKDVKKSAGKGVGLFFSLFFIIFISQMALMEKSRNCFELK